MRSFVLLLRSLLWTVLLPGMIAGFAPWRFFGVGGATIDRRDPVQMLALVIVAAGVLLLGTCILEFARSGRGTLSPVDPPKHLVVQGLYRYVRNPMYVGVSTIVLGQALLIRSLDLVIYWACFFVVVNVFIMAYEEPWLRRRFGASYEDYYRHVGRWIPRGTPHEPSPQRTQ